LRETLISCWWFSNFCCENPASDGKLMTRCDLTPFRPARLRLPAALKMLMRSPSLCQKAGWYRYSSWFGLASTEGPTKLPCSWKENDEGGKSIFWTAIQCCEKGWSH
jgi:hypothetical protein